MRSMRKVLILAAIVALVAASTVVYAGGLRSSMAKASFASGAARHFSSETTANAAQRSTQGVHRDAASNVYSRMASGVDRKSGPLSTRSRALDASLHTPIPELRHTFPQPLKPHVINPHLNLPLRPLRPNPHHHTGIPIHLHPGLSLQSGGGPAVPPVEAVPDAIYDAQDDEKRAPKTETYHVVGRDSHDKWFKALLKCTLQKGKPRVCTVVKYKDIEAPKPSAAVGPKAK